MHARLRKVGTARPRRWEAGTGGTYGAHTRSAGSRLERFSSCSGPGVFCPWQIRGPEKVFLRLVIKRADGSVIVKRDIPQHAEWSRGPSWRADVPEFADCTGEDVKTWTVKAALVREDTGEQCVVIDSTRHAEDKAQYEDDATWEPRDSYDKWMGRYSGPIRPYRLRVLIMSPRTPSAEQLAAYSEEVAKMPGDDVIDGVPLLVDGELYSYEGPAKHYATATPESHYAGAGTFDLASNLPIVGAEDGPDGSTWPARRELHFDQDRVAMSEAYWENYFDDDAEFELDDAPAYDRFRATLYMNVTRGNGLDDGEPMVCLDIDDTKVDKINACEMPALMSLLPWIKPLTDEEHEAQMAEIKKNVDEIAAAFWAQNHPAAAAALEQ